MRHNKTLKEAAVARILANEAPLLELAREYSVSTNTLRAWVRESKMAQPAAHWYDTPAGMQALIAALPQPLLLVDALGTILLANTAAEAAFEMSLPHGTPLSNLNLRWLDTDGKAPADARHPMHALLSGQAGETVLRARVGIVPPEGEVRCLAALMRAIRLPNAQEMAALFLFVA